MIQRNCSAALLIFLCVTVPPSCAFAQAKSHKNSVAFKNVTLEFDPSLSREYLAETVPAVPLENKTDKPDGVAPAHIVITLRDSYASRLRRDPSSLYALPQVSCFPTSDPSDPLFDQEFPTVRPAVSALNTLLARRAGSVTGSVPFLPWADQKQIFIGKKKLLRFRNGRGVAFLTQYEQERNPVNNTYLVYTFQGLTDDNAWYVSAVFPVAAPGLPATPAAGEGPPSGPRYADYIRQTTERLNKLSPKKFTPGLALLEEMIRSLKIGSRP